MAPREIGTGTRAKADEEDLKPAERPTYTPVNSADKIPTGHAPEAKNTTTPAPR